MHLAAIILLSLIITAPSCSGVLGIKIFIRSSLDTLESISQPVRTISPIFVPRSKTIRAPICLLDIAAAAAAISEAVAAASSCSVASSEEKFVRPTFSSAWRSSG